MSSSQQDACARALERELGDRAQRIPDDLERYAWDFGRIIRRVPAVVVSVHSPEELVTALRIGAEFRMPIATRGSAHSQSGQCLSSGALVVDMKALNDVQIDSERGWGWLHAGATWHQVANAAMAQASMPVGLTLIVDTTVGGTLSVGGLGSESFRTGTQADQILELEVATLDGKLTRCSPEHNRELYDAVRAGVGQCGIIVKARYPLRRAKARLRTHALLYTDRHALITDMLALTAQPRCEFMFSGLMWAEQGGWQLLLMLGSEFDAEAELNDARLLSGLQFKRELGTRDDPQWLSSGTPGHRFFRCYDEQSGGGAHHPWADHLCEPSAAIELLADMLSEPAIAPRVGTSGGLLVVASHANRAPLFLPRVAGPLLLLGVFPEPSSKQLPDALVRMRRHSERGCSLGGKRYVSGFMDGWGASEWSAHFGETWAWFQSMKDRFDPAGLLNNDCIRWR
jgi:FAD/FMN-containing dehydrogenase